MTKRSLISRLRGTFVLNPQLAISKLPAPSKRERKRIILGIDRMFDRKGKEIRIVRAMDPIANQNMRAPTGKREAFRRARQAA